MEGVILGVDLGGTGIKIGIVQGRRILDYQVIPAENHLGLIAALSRIRECVESMMKGGLYEITSVGFGFPGLVDCSRNRIIESNAKYPDAHQVDLAAWAMAHWKVPLHLDNDARLSAIGEWKYGAAENYSSVVVITLGTGIGTGVIINNCVLRGIHSRAGILGGHIPLAIDSNVRCSCGNVGCAEAYGSTWALQRDLENIEGAKSMFKKSISDIGFREVFNRLYLGCPEADKIAHRAISVWATLAVGLIHAYDPEVLVLTGNVMKSADIILPRIKTYVEENAWTPGYSVAIQAGRFPETAGLLGAAFIAKKEVGCEFL